MLIFVFTIVQPKDIFRALTIKELNKYLKGHDVSPIVIKNIDKRSLVLSENWFLSLSECKDSGIISSAESSIANNSSTEPVTIGFSSWGSNKESIYLWLQ